jgi:hypothetical protein
MCHRLIEADAREELVRRCLGTPAVRKHPALSDEAIRLARHVQAQFFEHRRGLARRLAN